MDIYKILKSKCFIEIIEFLNQSDWIQLQLLNKHFYEKLPYAARDYKVRIKGPSKWLWCASIDTRINGKKSSQRAAAVYRVKTPINCFLQTKEQYLAMGPENQITGQHDQKIPMPYDLNISERFWVVESKTYFCREVRKYCSRTFMFKPFYGFDRDLSEEERERRLGKVFELGELDKFDIEHGYLNNKCPKGYVGQMQIVSLIDVPSIKSILVYGKTLQKVSEDTNPDDEFDHCGFTGPGSSDEDYVYELIRYSYNRSFVNSFEQADDKLPLPVHNYEYSTFTQFDDQNGSAYIYVIGGLMVKMPLIYRLRFLIESKSAQSDPHWEPIEVKCDWSKFEVEHQFQFRRFLGVVPYNLENEEKPQIMIFGGCRKMQRMETSCVVEVNHKEKQMNILKQNKQEILMTASGPIEQNQFFISGDEIYALQFEYLHIFDKKANIWKGIKFLKQPHDSEEE